MKNEGGKTYDGIEMIERKIIYLLVFLQSLSRLSFHLLDAFLHIHFFWYNFLPTAIIATMQNLV